jgi:hypothetical protein
MTAQVLELFPDIAPSQVDPPAHNRTHKKSEKKAKDRYTAEFEAFWTMYPRKLNCSKLMAFRAWNKLDDEEQVQVQAVLPVFIRMMRGKDEQYIAHAVTWLNQKRFETIVIPPAVPSASAPAVDWAKARRIFEATGRWSAELGPEPGRPGYRGA